MPKLARGVNARRAKSHGTKPALLDQKAILAHQERRAFLALLVRKAIPVHKAHRGQKVIPGHRAFLAHKG
jgi:hypothetical protein